PRSNVPNESPLADSLPYPSCSRHDTMAATVPSPSRNRTEGPPLEEEAARDWAGLPWDALLAVLHRLDHVDVLMGAGQVCTPWRLAARNEPELWRRVEVRSHADRRSHAVDDSVLSLLADA
uniref:F-box domain-containing protein n=1 Tax=Aegilops tauschii subsp. strangulata TaxID=200361 RepID=A0A453C2M0_AEGTS